MEKNEDLQNMVQSTRFAYARRLKMAWEIKNWDRESTKVSRTQELIVVLNFHESNEYKMIHER